MKFALLALLAVIPFSAHAETKTFSFSCEGKLLAIGNTGRTGTVNVEASTEGGVIAGNPWNITIGWDGEDAIVGDNAVCGQDTSEDMSCASYSLNAAREKLGMVTPLALATQCNKGNEEKPLYRSSLLAQLVMDQANTHGRFSCSSVSGNTSFAIELSKCSNK